MERPRSGLYSQNATGADFSKAVYRYLLEVRADLLTRLRARRLDESGEPGPAERMARGMGYRDGNPLDRIAVIYREPPCNPKRLAEIFGDSRIAGGFGARCRRVWTRFRLEQPNRIRYSSPKAVFYSRRKRGGFPSYEGFGGVLTDIERNRAD